MVVDTLLLLLLNIIMITDVLCPYFKIYSVLNLVVKNLQYLAMLLFRLASSGSYEGEELYELY